MKYQITTDKGQIVGSSLFELRNNALLANATHFQDLVINKNEAYVLFKREESSLEMLCASKVIERIHDLMKFNTQKILNLSASQESLCKLALSILE